MSVHAGGGDAEASVIYANNQSAHEDKSTSLLILYLHARSRFMSLK